MFSYILVEKIETENLRKQKIFKRNIENICKLNSNQNKFILSDIINFETKVIEIEWSIYN